MSSTLEPPTLNIGDSFIVEIAPGYSITFAISDIDINIEHQHTNVQYLGDLLPKYQLTCREFTVRIEGFNVQ